MLLGGGGLPISSRGIEIQAGVLLFVIKKLATVGQE